MSYTIDGENVSLGEFEHAQRAEVLRLLFNTEKLANFLHQQYRAAMKSFSVGYNRVPFRHDHGWSSCTVSGKNYFLRRAAWLLTTRPSFNGRKVDPR